MPISLKRFGLKKMYDKINSKHVLHAFVNDLKLQANHYKESIMRKRRSFLELGYISTPNSCYKSKKKNGWRSTITVDKRNISILYKVLIIWQ